MHITFSEILVILLVTILVIKPERLPEVATVLGRWMRGLRRFSSKIKEEIDMPLSKYSFHDKNDIKK